MYKNKKVLIMGLGLHGGGVGVAKFFLKHGADVLITDLKTKVQLRESLNKLKGKPVKYSLGGHKEKDFISSDLIIKNPDVSNTSRFLEIARKNNIPIETDVNIFLKNSKARVIGITGTKGKSTTASLIFHFLKTKYPGVYLAGNIGVSPLEIIDKAKIAVLELSSFELEDITKSPDIAVITNIMPDHLNRYKGIDEYIEAKKNIFKFQKKNDILVLNYDNDITRGFFSKSKTYFYSCFKKPDNPGAYLKNRKVYFKKEVMDLKDFKPYGEHNVSNLLAAVSVSKLMGVPCENIRKAVKKFKGVSGRQEFVGEVKGVKYFNDTTATMPEAVIEALKSLKSEFPKSKIILIAGGQNKGLDYKNMADEIEKSAYSLVLLPGTASDEIIKEVKRIKIYPVSSMKQAVLKARKISSPSDIIILSPGAASFNLFKNEFDRGDQFKKWALKKY